MSSFAEDGARRSRLPPPTVIPFGVSTVPLRLILNSAGFLAPEVQVFELRKVASSRNLLVTDPKIGKALAEVLG